MKTYLQWIGEQLGAEPGSKPFMLTEEMFRKGYVVLLPDGTVETRPYTVYIPQRWGFYLAWLPLTEKRRASDG